MLRKKKLVFFILFFLVSILASIIINNLWQNNVSIKTELPNSNNQIIITTDSLDAEMKEIISEGDKVLVSTNTNSAKKQAVELFQKKNYTEAISEFQRSLIINQNDPETLIYWHNAHIKPLSNKLTKTNCKSI